MKPLAIMTLPYIGFLRLAQKAAIHANKKILIKSIFSICAGLTVSGCIGIGAIATMDYPAYLNTPSSAVPISFQSGANNTSRKISYNYGGSVEKRYDDARILKAWGKPDEIKVIGPYTVWTYYEPELRWSGIALHVLVTIPLAIPTGKEKYSLYFKDNVLEKALSHTSRTNLFVCDPLYMLISGMAASMSPTGNGSVLGPCTLINRRGIYFHFITNY
ncbi:hypothetical protein [Pseudomonas xionganensis]|uniref:Uncharacterized protein n=1 Tax=Pseudomonas xionganensis TaxID=2654845 RepID=A0A6I4KMT1_9PSED|nr:hypothetical protein [Pseudomonas xionganensis]MVW73959.1 hypothetical protein [Pseudomonas xionganensis]